MSPADGMRSELQVAVSAAFAFGGPLQRADAQYRERGAQLELAAAVADAIDAREVLVAEAGTGVGKTFAYLVPALLAGHRTLISTATKSLQDQLFLRDLPRLREVLALPVSVALLKGRSSYLCLQRLVQAREATALPDRYAARTLAKIEQWAQRTTSGDLAELEGLDERSSVIPLVTSTRENCLGSECPEYRGCHVMKARREAMAADLVVVNHHLFFADLSLRDTGMAELLPSVDVAVFDEAHQLAEAGVAFLGITLGSAQVVDFARDMLAVGLAQARGLQPWQELAAGCDRAARDLRLAANGPLREVRGSLKLRWGDRADRADFIETLAALGRACRSAADALDVVVEMSPDLAKLAERASTLATRAAGFGLEAEPGRVRWIDLTPQGLRLVESPLDVRDAMREQIAAAPKAWIFTSATLGADERLTWFTEQAGLETARTLRVDSPFDYPMHARLYVPTRFPKPNEPGHTAAVARLAAACARAAGGRTFVLTTTLRALSGVGEALQADFEGDAEPITVLMQGSVPKRQLLQRFLDTPRAVLVGSQSFWEGIDVPGEALQCVIIDKLPFPPPNDPLVEARVKRLESEGRNPFNDYFVAEAAVSLKQGAGRLIRSESDRGLLVVCDPRMGTMGYGHRLRAALPPMQVLREEAQALAWLAEISKAAPAWV
ncbi:ATP-dependent DNA helicase [Methylibium petroleiphilum]|uniref:ATP-dependent DNA helicase n=1 Tax=Methylibium petroleiphilum TaxID=105560 RepID=UPI0023522096|nr:ATP-dependent DNA helicase [Methylibium petroleiphilum]